ncbi:MAG: hypothetical protein QXZ66_06220 [Thermoproteota archaeon]
MLTDGSPLRKAWTLGIQHGPLCLCLNRMETVYHVERQREYVAFFGELSFLHPDMYVFNLSTKMNIIPPAV